MNSFVEKFFDQGFNPISFFIEDQVRDMVFFKQPSIAKIQKDVWDEFATNFTKGNLKLAKKRLELN